MYYYIYRDVDGNITAYDQTNSLKRPPAIQVTKEEFKALGLHSEVLEHQREIEEPASTEEPDSAELIQAIIEGVNSV